MHVAVNAQCLHCSSFAFKEKKHDGDIKAGLGTAERTCHQDWIIGYNGIKQATAKIGVSSHLACIYFYIASFDDKFTAVTKSKVSNEAASDRDDRNPPSGFFLGYKQPNVDHGEFIYCIEKV